MGAKRINYDQFDQVEKKDGSYILTFNSCNGKQLRILKISTNFLENNTVNKIEINLLQKGKINTNIFYTDSQDYLILNSKIKTEDKESLSLFEYFVNSKSHVEPFLQAVFKHLIVPALKKL